MSRRLLTTLLLALALLAGTCACSGGFCDEQMSGKE
jgi:hypothetical protein